MALKTVAARVEGDIFQGRFFWYHACRLLMKTSKVARIAIEYDQASGADDVAVFYEAPGINDAGRLCIADFYQCKYHVDRRDCYSADNIIDPAFINAKSSLLQRLHHGYRSLDLGKWFRLNFVSNWRWLPDDRLAKVLRERDGALPDEFFSDGSKSNLGKIREAWQQHLKTDESEFEDFARRLRFGLDHFGRTGFSESLSDRLSSVGLKRIEEGQQASIYDTLFQQFIVDGPSEFDREAFRLLCKREGLIENGRTDENVKVIGVRSFMRFAEHMEDETSDFVCVAENFEGRYVRAEELWGRVVIPKAREFLRTVQPGDSEIHLLLECHNSLAFLAGYELDRKSGVTAYPIQKGMGRTIWKPTGRDPVPDWMWKVEYLHGDDGRPDVAIALSVTHNVFPDVVNFITSRKIPVKTIVQMAPVSGSSPSALRGPDHAARLAELAMQEIRQLTRETAGTAHVFAAAPNGFMFLLGTYRAALGRIQLYEFDFEGDRGGSYFPSFSLPL